MIQAALNVPVVLLQDIGEKTVATFYGYHKPEAEKEYRVGTHHLNSTTMKYIIKGTLRGLLCSDCFMHLSRVRVRIYRASGDNITAVAAADAAQTFHQLTEEEVKRKNKMLIAETTTDSEGNYSFELDEKQYKGEAYEIDIVLDTNFGKEKQAKDAKEYQFHITTRQPEFRERDKEQRAILIDYWRYDIIAKWWCRILQLLDLWVICGRVVDCETKQPIPGVKVSAFDRDWMQDDPLGSAFTDANGYFKIYYTSAAFKQTLLSPWLNIEWQAGPDIYFKIESSSGAVLLSEDRNTGRREDRANRGNCFCVTLCVKDGPVANETPWFTHVGNYSITNDISAVTGRTTQNRSFATGIGFGFFGNVKLVGYATKRVPTAPGSALHYRFRYSTDGSTWQNITATQITQARLKVGTRMVPWGSGTAFQDVVIDPLQAASAPDALPVFDPMNPSTPPADHVLHPDANGWVRVDQPALDNGFYGPLMWLNTNTIVPGGAGASAGDAAGNLPSTPRNGHIVHIAFQTTDNPATNTNLGDPNFNEQVMQAHIYVNNWGEVSLLKLDELFAGSGGCTPVSASATVRYTADHELIADWGLGVSSAAVPGGITINHSLTAGSTARGNAQVFNMAAPGETTPPFSAWPSCAYSLVLSTRRKLTDGENNDHARSNQVIFCK